MQRFVAFLFLLATVLPLGYPLFVTVYFKSLVELELYRDGRLTWAFASYNFFLAAIYCRLTHKNESIPRECKTNWYVGFIVAAPLVGAYYWTKQFWPNVDR